MEEIFTLEYAKKLDENDELKSFRDKFNLNDSNLIYMDGNSLGALPCDTKPHLYNVIEKEWGDGLIRSWNEGWYERASKLGAKIATIIGAQPDEVIVADSTSVNLFKLAFAALKFQSKRATIVSDTINFPSDLYILQGLIDIFGNQHQLKLANSEDGITVSMDELENQLGNNAALLTLSHVVFKSSFMYNMEEVTQLAHSKGTMVIWDLSHAAGAVPVKLNKCNADMAIGCTYKYFNGGPGSTAFLYVRKDLQDKLQSPIWGWFGQNNPFEFGLNYSPAKGIARFLAGTPPLLSLSAIEPSVDIMIEAGIDKLRAKSIMQTEYLISLFDKFLSALGYTLGSPRDFKHRGSHVSLKHNEAYRICKALIDRTVCGKTVIPDFRQPDNIRLGIAPLYNTYSDIYQTIMQMHDIVAEGKYLAFSGNRNAVT